MSGHLLTVTLLLPLAGAVALTIVSRAASDRDARLVALLAALITFASSLVILRDFHASDPLKFRASMYRTPGRQST